MRFRGVPALQFLQAIGHVQGHAPMLRRVLSALFDIAALRHVGNLCGLNRKLNKLTSRNSFEVLLTPHPKMTVAFRLIYFFARGSAVTTAFVLLGLAATTACAELLPVDLRCDYALNPLGVDSAAPRLFWKLDGSARGQRQTAYEILAASSSDKLAQNAGDLWDSGRVASDETIQIPYAGKPLSSFQSVFWKVRVWDQDGSVSPWSEPADWTMGVRQSADWQGKWIGAADTKIASLLVRREFAVKPGLKRALLNICGLGQYELTLNGHAVGEDFLSPGWTTYSRTCLYDTRDITPLLQPGNNAVGIELGDGMYNLPSSRFRPPAYKPYSFGPQKVIAQIRLEYGDGTIEYVGTDESWRTAAGAITATSIYSGEDFDARRIQEGWDTTGFDDSKWVAAQVVDGPGGALKGMSAAAPPIRFFEVQAPVSSRVIADGDVLYDLGQNAAHVPRITVTGPAGSRVRIIPSELGDGLASTGSMGERPRQAIWCDYTKATDGEETWSPAFFYNSSRYFEVRSFPADGGTVLPAVKSIDGIVVQSSSEAVGEFACSNALFNRIYTLIRWAQRSNMVSLMTDCPTREKRGWLEQDHLNGPALRYDYDLAQLFAKIVHNMDDVQFADGLMPTTAPEYTIFQNRGQTGDERNAFGDSPEWGSACVLVPWQQYEFDGDTPLLREQYETMQKYAAYLGTRAKDNIVDYGLGDWCDVGPKPPGVAQLTPIALTATAFYYQDTEILARVAALLGKDDEAKQYAAQAERIRASFNAKFYDPAKRSYATGSQTANAIPLVMGLCEPANRAAVLAAIVQDVQTRGNALTAGDVGYRYLLRALADGGRSDVIFAMNNQSDKPGYGYQLKKGATSLVETWDARPNVSQNHFMLGQLQEWFFHDLAGIQNSPGSAGFKHISIAPQPVGDVTWVKASYNSIRGKIVSDWSLQGHEFTLDTTIPPGITATIFVPAAAADTVTEGGRPAAESPGLQYLRMENGHAIYEAGSGHYAFAAPWGG